ncbi:MAG: hypothetical protein ACXU9A_00570 [Xanthobacteraceae bacterium]
MADDDEREWLAAGWPQHPRLQHGAGRGRERDDLPGGTLDRDRRRGRQSAAA